MDRLPDADGLAALLAELIPLGGLAGHEYPISEALAARLRPYAAAVTQDRLGNVIARFGPEHAAQRIAVLAHLDTVGMLVKQVEPGGLLRVVPVGGVNLKALPGATVAIWTSPRPGDLPQPPGLPGVITVRAQHQARPGDLAPDFDTLTVQVDPAAVVPIAAPITFAPQIVRQGPHLFSSPHLDNRAGCAVLLALAEWLAGADLPADRAITLIGTVQEETTCAGAFHALQAVAPTIALFVDGTLSYDTPETRGGAVSLGNGPVLTAFLYVSGLNGWHADPRLRAGLARLATAHGIAHQHDAIRGLISDARTALWAGIPSALVGLPMRSKHAPLETLDLRDLVGATRLLAAALSGPDLLG